MKSERKVDVFGVGNALVDILAFVDESYVRDLDLPKGSMNLVDAALRSRILSGFSADSLERKGGGSAANSLFILSQCGGSARFAGKVAKDADGDFFAKDLLRNGLDYDINPVESGSVPTGTSIILTTPDAERTMCTHLGASILLGPDDILEKQVAECKTCYVEGYLWSDSTTREAALRSLKLASELGVTRCFTFSDSFLVEAFLEDFKELVSDHSDVVFCNANEACRFTGDRKVEDAAAGIGQHVPLAYVTMGKDGCLLVNKGRVKHVEGFGAKAIDTVGAGDAFAGGVLFGLTRGHSPEAAAICGNYLASRVVEVRGPRLQDVDRKLIASFLGNT